MQPTKRLLSAVRWVMRSRCWQISNGTGAGVEGENNCNEVAVDIVYTWLLGGKQYKGAWISSKIEGFVGCSSGVA